MGENELVQNPSWASVKQFFVEVWEPSTVSGYYQPVTMVSLMLDVAVGGGTDHVGVFHRTSLGLHTVNVVLVVVLVILLLGHWPTSVVAGLLFGLHPLTVESIPWVAERKTLLAAFFALGSLLFT